MARIFQLPISFDFRTTKVQWAGAYARVVGWNKKDDGTVDGDNVLAAVETEGGRRKLVSFPLDRLPEDTWERCIEMPCSEESDSEIEAICAGFMPHLLICSGGGHVTDSELCKRPPADAWQMRDDFLRLEGTGTSALTFLRKWGKWGSGWVEVREMISLQSAVREALTSNPTKWFASSKSSLSLWRQTVEYPYFNLRTDQCALAIRISVTIDLLQRVKFKICARRDCAAPFSVTSRHRREYCSQYCGHLESVRRGRKKEGN
jgi:hypothetical protein